MSYQQRTHQSYTTTDAFVLSFCNNVNPPSILDRKALCIQPWVVPQLLVSYTTNNVLAATHSSILHHHQYPSRSTLTNPTPPPMSKPQCTHQFYTTNNVLKGVTKKTRPLTHSFLSKYFIIFLQHSWKNAFSTVKYLFTQNCSDIVNKCDFHQLGPTGPSCS